MSPRGEELNEKMRNDAIDKISQSALEQFSSFGYHGTTMKQIMNHSNLSKGLLYHYFPSKQDLFLHLIKEALSISKKIWTDSLSIAGTAWQKIENLATELIKTAFTEKNILYYLIMVQAFTQGASIPGIPEFLMANMSHYELLPPLIIEAQNDGDIKDGDPELLFTTFNATFLGYTMVLMDAKEIKKKLTPSIFTDILKRT